MSCTTIVVPCYNEGQRLDLQRFRTFIEGTQNIDFLLVDDGSRDNTIELIQHLCESFPQRVRLFRMAQNSGKAEAVRQGCSAAMSQECDYVGFWDADLATPLDEISRFSDVLDREPSISCVLASRIPLLGHAIERQRYRRWLGRLFAQVASLGIGLRVYDTQCGAKLFRVTPKLRKVFDKPFLSRWIFDVEILARMLALDCPSGRIGKVKTFYELPLDRWCDVAGSKLKSRDFVKAIFELLRICFTYRWFVAQSPDLVTNAPPQPDKAE